LVKKLVSSVIRQRYTKQTQNYAPDGQ